MFATKQKKTNTKNNQQIGLWSVAVTINVELEQTGVSSPFLDHFCKISFQIAMRSSEKVKFICLRPVVPHSVWPFTIFHN